MSKLTNLFEDFRNYQSKKVDSPYYELLGQSITISTPVEDKKKKRNEYARQYRAKNRDKLNKYQREYRKKTHVPGGKREGLLGIQKEVYDYLVKQYQKGENLSRGAEIAKALGMKDSSVYTAIFQLVKKGYVGKGTYGRYLLTKFPDNEEDELKQELAFMGEDLETNNRMPTEESEMIYIEEDNYDKLVQQNADLRNENIGLREKIEELEDKVKGLEEQVNNSVGHIEGLMDSNTKLEVKNLTLSNNMEELKRVIKVLLKYFVSDVQ